MGARNSLWLGRKRKELLVHLRTCSVHGNVLGSLNRATSLIAAPEATGSSLLEEKRGSEELTGLSRVTQQTNRRGWIQVSMQYRFPRDRESKFLTIRNCLEKMGWHRLLITFSRWWLSQSAFPAFFFFFHFLPNFVVKFHFFSKTIKLLFIRQTPRQVLKTSNQ